MQFFFAIENPIWLPTLKIYKQLKEKYDVKVISPRLFRSTSLLKSKKRIIAEEIIYFLYLLLKAGRFIDFRDCIIVCSSKHYCYLLLSKILSYFNIQTNIFIYNFYLHKAGQLRIVQYILRYLITKNTSIIAQSKYEERYFKKLGPRGHIFFSQYGNGPFTFIPDYKISFGDYIFSGGYTNRDYNLLLRCAARLPHINFIIVCSKLNNITEKIPHNVKIFRDLALDQFYSLLAGSRMVIIPLVNDTGSSGQMVCLAAMQYSKAIVYANFDVLSQYFADNMSGIAYMPNSEDSLFSIISSIFHNNDKLSTLGANAKKIYYENYTRKKFEHSIISHLDTFINMKI
jgi:glycosyltransferase involved in cell wall biosynthesis